MLAPRFLLSLHYSRQKGSAHARMERINARIFTRRKQTVFTAAMFKRRGGRALSGARADAKDFGSLDLL